MIEAFNLIIENCEIALWVWFILSIIIGLGAYIIVKILMFISDHNDMKKDIEELNNKVEKLEKRRNKRWDI